MGHSAGSSVVGEFNRSHDVPNLYVCDSSSLPTSGGVNPTFTVHALAARSAERLLATWKQVAG